MGAAAFNTYLQWLIDNPGREGTPFFILPELEAAGYKQGDVITDPVLSVERLVAEGVDFPKEFRDSDGNLRFYLGDVPLISETYHGFDCVKVKVGNETNRYLLFAAKGQKDASRDFGDHLTWHGPRTRNDADRDAANERWKELIG